ncbi:LOW QUALITY PROTEIN: glyoxalase family protein [Bacillus sp. JCM 19045]|nr:LOW QUALITY PROTEIN: glyoxalase family protein [Bacillus sp. JCM 19045]
MLSVRGYHHVSAYTRNASENATFYTQALGLTLVKKTVNQDNPFMYHLFYGDEQGNPGTEITFFELPHAAKTHRGSDAITLTTFIVNSVDALTFWKTRFDNLQITHSDIQTFNEYSLLRFEDQDGQRLAMLSKGDHSGETSTLEGIPQSYRINQLGPNQLTVSDVEQTIPFLVSHLGFNHSLTVDGVAVLHASANDEVEFVEQNSQAQKERPGRGSVHHIAFAVADLDELQQWSTYFTDAGFQHSGVVNRHYFHSLYIKDGSGIVYELATEGSGFTIDEKQDVLGQRLSLPPFLETKRTEIEQKLKPVIIGGQL